MISLRTGQALKHYVVLEKIGQGGMGRVYKAEDTRLGRFVALKLLPEEAAASETARQRLLQEARSASVLSHPAIVTIYSIEEHEGTAFIVMEYVEGQTLRATVERGAFPLARLLGLGAELADALAAAHAVNIIHRDIKSENILLTPRGGVKILDFGLAKSVRPVFGEINGEAPTRVDLTGAGVVLGTVHYMSPEQTRGEPLDARSDIFSLGCVLYEAATGRLPFSGPSLLSVAHDIATADPTPPSRMRAELPVEFDLIVERAMAKDRAQRYSSAAELADALRLLRGASLEAPRLSDESPTLSPADDEREALVGRGHELKRLDDLLRRSVEGSGRVLFVTGEPGIGKSALVSEFLRRARRGHPGVVISRGRCVEQYGTGEAYLPFLDAVGSLLTGPHRERIVALLRTYAPTWCLQFPAAFVSSTALEKLQQETAGATKERMLREMGDMLAALSAQAPAVLVLEDLHWADPSSIDLLRHLSHRVADRRLLVVGTYRPEDVAVANHPFQGCKRELDARAECEEIALGALGREHLASYLDARFRPNDFPPELPDLILQKTGGHPLFATRLAQYLAERGDIAHGSGVWSLAPDLSALDLGMPESVLSMIRKRIEALGEEERRTLRHASVQGEEFLSTLVAGSLGADPVEVEERLDRLARAHRLIRARGEEELPDGALATRYSFSHALYQNVLYGDLVSQRRRQLHALAGETLERHYGDDAPRVAAQLAVHFERGRDFARAVRYLSVVGDNAAALHATAEAAGHYARALSLAERLPAPERADALVRLHLKRGAVETARSRFDSAHDDFARAAALAREGGLPDAELSALNGLIKVLFFARRMDEAARHTDEALALAGRTGNEALRLETLAFVVQRHMRARSWGEAVPLAERIVREAEALGHRPALLSGLVERGELHFQLCEYALADETLARAVSLAAEMCDGFMRLYGLFLLGLVAANSGRMSRALEHLGEAERLAERNGDRFWLARLPSTLGWIYRELQDFERALAHDRRGLEIARADSLPEVEANALLNFCQEYARRGDSDAWERSFREIESVIERHPWMHPRYHIRLQSVMAEYWLAMKDFERADDHARLLVELTTKHEMHKDAAVARLLLAEAAAARGLTGEAAAQLDTSLALTAKYHAPLVAWRVHAARARLFARTGDAGAARSAYREARRVLEAIAAGTSDEGLRATFLASAAVGEVLEAAGAGPAENGGEAE